MNNNVMIGGVGAVWSINEKNKVKKLDKEFASYLRKKNISPTSYEASLEWKKAGFQEKFKKIFNK